MSPNAVSPIADRVPGDIRRSDIHRSNIRRSDIRRSDIRRTVTVADAECRA